MRRAQGWWEAPATPRQAYLLAGTLGLCVYLVVYGPGHMFGTSSYWDMPQEDSRAYMMAYRYFLHEPWHWPIFTSHTINLPATKTFALSDGIPIWALVNKTMSTVIPPWRGLSDRAYLGLWHAVSHVLQPCLAVAILRLFGHRTRGHAVMTAVFCLALPAWIWRYQHAALSAHFLILWPIYLYLRTPVNALPPRRLQIGWLCEFAVVAMTNPYHVVMSFGFFVAALVRSRRARAAAWIPAVFAVIAVAFVFAGYVSRATATPMGGFESYSTNMMSMFVAPNSGILGDVREWFGDVEPIYNQYEGMAYIGLGLVVLFLLFLPGVRSIGPVIKRHPALFALALGAWCLALSNRIFFNSELVLSYEMPHQLHAIREWFRAPGRFAYVPMYVLIVFLLQWGFTKFATGWKRLILPALAVIQLVDATGEWRFQHDYTQSPYKHKLPMEAWRTLVHAHATVLELPTFDCLGDDPDKLKPSLEIAYYASERALPINGVYGARPVRDCTEDERRFPNAPEDGTLYVWFAKSDRHARRFVARGASCGAFEYGWACSTNHEAIAVAMRAGALEPMTPSKVSLPLLAYGQRIQFGTASSKRFLTEGWSYEEATGRWSEGPVATLQFRMTGDLAPSSVMKLNAASMMCGRRQSQDVDVAVNDTTLATLHFDRGTNDIETVRSISVPGRLLQGPEVIVDFKPHDVRPPNTVRCNDDPRRTGVWLRELWFEAQP